MCERMAGQKPTSDNIIFSLLRLFKGEDILIVGLAVFLAGLAAIGAWWPKHDLSILLIACIFCMLGVAGVNASKRLPLYANWPTSPSL